jgi:hypothetical protein
VIVHITQKRPKVMLYQFGFKPLEVTRNIAHVAQDPSQFDQAALGRENALERRR